MAAAAFRVRELTVPLVEDALGCRSFCSHNTGQGDLLLQVASEQLGLAFRSEVTAMDLGSGLQPVCLARGYDRRDSSRRGATDDRG